MREVAMIPEEERQQLIDGEHLKLLALAYAIDGGTYGVFSVFGLLYAAMGAVFGAAIAHAPPQASQGPPPEFMGWFFGLFGLAMFLGFISFGALKLLCAQRIKTRRSRTLCLVVAAISCLAIPYGTAIGVWTFMVLTRPSVAELFVSTHSQA
jgi:hypothetical protein